MKLTLANIKELKRKSDSPLTRRVCNYVIDRWGDYDDKKRTRGQGHHPCPRLRFQKAFRRKYKPASSFLHRQDKGTDDARNQRGAENLYTIRKIHGGMTMRIRDPTLNFKKFSNLGCFLANIRV